MPAQDARSTDAELPPPSFDGREPVTGTSALPFLPGWYEFLGFVVRCTIVVQPK